MINEMACNKIGDDIYWKEFLRIMQKDRNVNSKNNGQLNRISVMKSQSFEVAVDHFKIIM